MHWALLALTGVCAWRVATFVPAELTVLNDLTGALSERTKNTESVEQAKALLTEDDRVFYIAMPDNGISWFMDSFEFYPRSACGLQLRRRQLDGIPARTSRSRADAMPAVLYGRAGGLLHSAQPLTRRESVCDYLIGQTGCTAALHAMHGTAAFAEQYGASVLRTASRSGWHAVPR